MTFHKTFSTQGLDTWIYSNSAMISRKERPRNVKSVKRVPLLRLKDKPGLDTNQLRKIIDVKKTISVRHALENLEIWSTRSWGQSQRLFCIIEVNLTRRQKRYNGWKENRSDLKIGTVSNLFHFNNVFRYCEHYTYNNSIVVNYVCYILTSNIT